MKLRTDRLYPFVIAVILAGGAYWLNLLVNQEPGYIKKQKRQEPDYFVEDSLTRKFDEEGKLHYIFKSQKVVHYPAENLSRMQNPDLHEIIKDGILDITAEYGEHRQNGKEIFLQKNVKAVKTPSSGADKTVLTGNSLIIWPDSEKTMSKEPVRIVKGGTVLTGDSMHSDSIYGDFQLQGKSKIRLPPK